MKTIFVIIQFGTAIIGPAAEQTFGSIFDTRNECEQKLLEITAKLGGEIVPSSFEDGFYRHINGSNGKLLYAERCVKVVYND